MQQQQHKHPMMRPNSAPKSGSFIQSCVSVNSVVLLYPVEEPGGGESNRVHAMSHARWRDSTPVHQFTTQWPGWGSTKHVWGVPSMRRRQPPSGGSCCRTRSRRVSDGHSMHSQDMFTAHSHSTQSQHTVTAQSTPQVPGAHSTEAVQKECCVAQVAGAYR